MIRRLLAPVFVFTATLLPAAPAVPLVNLVDDQTIFALSVTDAPALLRGWDAGPLATTWNDPQVVKFLAPLREEMKVADWDADTREATGLSIRELLGLAEGEVLLAVPAFDFAKLDSDAPPPFLMALEVGGQAEKIEKMLVDSAAKKSLKEETETFSGVKVTIRPVTSKDEADEEPAPADGEAAKAAAPSTVSWAIVEGILLISAEKERVFSAIDAVKQGGLGAALGKSERFLRTRERVGVTQSLVYLNFPAIYPALRDAVILAKAKAAGNPLGLDPETVFGALGLDALGECYLALRISDTETRMDGGLLYAEERGLLKLIAYQPGPAVQPDWIPAKWPSVSTARFSLSKAYEGLEELLEAISPMMSGMAQGQIRAFNKKLRIDLKRDLIGSVGDDFVSAYAVPPGLEPGAVPAWTEMDQLFAFSLVNEESFTKSIDALKSLAGPAAEQMFTKRDYLGNALYTLNLPPAEPGAKPARGFSYAIANGTFLLGIGSPATVENALQGMASSQGLFWKRDDVKAALADLPSNAAGLQVQDLRVMIASIIETAVQMQELANAQKSDDEKKNYVDVSARPDAEVIARHWGMSGGYVTRTPEGLFSTTRLAHPKK
ncbi:MAG: hypothetical protein K0R17_1573 [Rariglobus sp.]|jgi:hypothetical protein|nr:hypothetical protein [Rariglobus sp.]